VVGAAPELFLDLGSGGGLPGLALMEHWPETQAVLLDANRRRCVFLQEAVDALDLAGRVSVDHRRAEEAGRDPQRRAACDMVVSRGFGPPAVTAECGAPFLRVGGLLIVSEPPEDVQERWTGVEEFGLVREHAPATSAYAIFRQRFGCPERYPRRTGIPAKRPLWSVPVSRETSEGA
jgi:16S rRNA (guanine527-N7)-methyltransferase